MNADESNVLWTICPYCKAKFHDYQHEEDGNEPGKTMCEKCGKLFWQWVECSVRYCTAKVEEGEES